LRLVLIGGFLGAGKSTWLRHQLYTRRFGRVHLFVNEAAETPVDNLLLGRAERVDVLAGGCACCEGRPALLEALRQLCDREASAATSGIDTVLLETSGLADPFAIASAIAADPILTRRLVLTRTIVLVDALHSAAQLTEEPLARRQVEAADEIAVTKVAKAALADLSRLAASLRGLAPAATVSFLDFGVPVDKALDPTAEPYLLPTLSEEREPIRPHRLDVGQAGGWVVLSTWLSVLLEARGESILRAKGVVRTPAGRLLLQSVRRAVEPPEILPEPDDAAGAPPDDDIIVLIGRGIDDARLQESWNRFALGH
jgi:G3E family GTPase